MTNAQISLRVLSDPGELELLQPLYEQSDGPSYGFLQGFLDQVTEIKLEALTQLTHEELRSDQAFSIFILQCGNLISKIQMKILNCPSP